MTMELEIQGLPEILQKKGIKEKDIRPGVKHKAQQGNWMQIIS